MGQHLMQSIYPEEVTAAWANVMRVSCRRVGKRFENSKSCVGESAAKPGTGAWFLLYPS